MINKVLVAFSALVVALANYSLGLLIQVGLQLVADLSHLDEKSTPPCGIATPRLSGLVQGAAIRGGRDYRRFYGFPSTTESEHAEELMKDLCEAPSGNLSEAVRRMFESDITASEHEVRTRVCDAGEAEGGRDPMRRVMRAYLRASTAFARLSANTADCRWGDDSYPFGGECRNANFVHEQLLDAMREPVIEGLQGAMPSVSAALYRLVALAVIAQKDRDKNDGRCFRNAQSQSAEMLCTSVYEAARSPLAVNEAVASPPPPGLPRGDAYAFDLWENGRLLPSCAEHNASPASQASGSPSASPPSPRADFADVDEVSMSNSVRQCVRQHTQALYDVQDLYNLPNFNRAPDFDEPNGPLKLFFLHNNYVKLIDNWFYKNRKNHAASDAKRELMVFSAARIAIDLIWFIWGLCMSVHFTVVGGVPLVMSARRTETIVRPELSLSQYLALLSSFLYACYVFTVHPIPAPLLPRLGGNCDDKWDGSVYGKSVVWRDDATKTALIQLALLLLVVFYHTYIRKVKGRHESRRLKYLLQPLAACVAFGLVALNAHVLAAVLQEWVDEVRDSQSPWAKLPDIRKKAENELQALIVGAAGWTAAASSMQTLFALKKASLGLRVVWFIGIVLLIWAGHLTKFTLYQDSDPYENGVSLATTVLAIFLTVFVLIGTSNVPSSDSGGAEDGVVEGDKNIAAPPPCVEDCGAQDIPLLLLQPQQQGQSVLVGWN